MIKCALFVLARSLVLSFFELFRPCLSIYVYCFVRNSQLPQPKHNTTNFSCVIYTVAVCRVSRIEPRSYRVELELSVTHVDCIFGDKIEPVPYLLSIWQHSLAV